MLLWKYPISNSALNEFLFLVILSCFCIPLAVATRMSNTDDIDAIRRSTASLSSTKTGNQTLHSGDLLCTPFGACEPCGSEDINEPFCQPFGNRRLMHCVNSTTTSIIPPSGTSNQSNLVPELLAWESCGRIPAKERADFYEFIACNVAFAIVSLAVLFFRERRLRLGRARMLAARIGVGLGRR